MFEEILDFFARSLVFATYCVGMIGLFEIFAQVAT